MKILLITKQKDYFVPKVIELLENYFTQSDLTIIEAEKGASPLQTNSDLTDWQGDYVISYLSPWVIPEWLLQRATRGAINFHPGPPEYPGIGCTNFAIYNNETSFGVTCHYMAGKVDSGKIIEVRRVQLIESDTVYTLTLKCYAALFDVFCDIITKIKQDEPLPESSETWQRKPYTRKQLNELCLIDPSLPAEEIKRRVRATSYPGYEGPFVNVDGEKIAFHLYKSKQPYERQ